MNEHMYKVAVVTPRPKLRLSKQTYGYHIHCYYGDAVIWDKAYGDRDKAYEVFGFLEDLIHKLCKGLRVNKSSEYPQLGLWNITHIGEFDMKKIEKARVKKE